MLGATNQPLTVSMRVKLDSNYDSSITRYPLMCVNRYYVYISQYLHIGGAIWGGQNVNTNTTLSLNTVYDFMFTYDGTTLSVYLNGIAENSLSSGSTASGTNDVCLGMRLGETTTTYKGLQDNVRIWNRVLSSNEISIVSGGGFAPTSGLVLELGFDNQDVTDSSPIGNTPTVSNITYVTGIAPFIPDAVSQLDVHGLITASSLTSLGATALGTVTTGVWNATNIAITHGGTGAGTQQGAINSLTGSQVSGKYLRSDGTNATLASIQAADVPTLNQNTTGTAATITGSVTESQVTSLTSDLAATEKTVNKGVASGYASLDSGGKVPTSQLPSSVLGALEYQGAYDASGGSFPASPSKGYYWVISVAGTISGTSYKVGDWLTYDGSGWDKIDNSQAVSSVAGRTGTVVLGESDITNLTTDLAAKSSKAYAIAMAISL